MRAVKPHPHRPGAARAAVFATVSDVDLDLVSALSRWMTSLFCPSDVYFHPYDADEIRGILRDRIRFGLYPGVFPAAALDQVVGVGWDEADPSVHTVDGRATLSVRS
ncbi:MAG TPA: hypothetical protein PLR09_08015 [Candidatus Methanoculleus thermohydrogenotrophicum]|jgi:cell division control protein 6|nr:hypothetical protein [Candidatus Methanoculleus thermohydrogenotrophicum]